MLNGLTLTYKGRDADQHIVEARLLGRSLIGVDRIANAGLILLVRGRAPRRGERFDFYVSARAPEAGSVDVGTLLQHAPFLLPLVQEFVVLQGAEYLKQFMAWVLFSLGGRRSDAQEYMRHTLALVSEMNRHHEAETSRWLAAAEALLPQLQHGAREAVAPVGPSASQLLLRGGDQSSAPQIDEPMADVIRSGELQDVRDMEDMNLRVDGFIHHTRQLKVEHPSMPGRFITAEVRDPIFDVVPNPYSEAATGLGIIRVQVKPVFKAGELHKLYIMNFIGPVAA